MNNKELVKLDLLNRKIYEYFSRNPKAKSAVFMMEAGGDKTHWKVTRHKGGLKIVEVQSKTKKFVMEAPVGQVQAQEQDAIRQMQQAQQAQQQQAAAQQVAQPAPVPLPPPGAPMTPMSTAPMGAPPAMPVAPPPVVPMAPAPMPPVSPAVPAEPTIAGTGAAKAAADAVEQAKASDPEGFAQYFGATPQAQLQNPNVPPHVAIGGTPPDERGGQQISAGVEPLTEAGVDYTNMRNLFMQAVDQPTVPNLQAATSAIGASLHTLSPQEKASAEQMLQALASWQGRGASPAATTAASIMTRGPAVHFSHREVGGKKLHEAPGDEVDVSKKKDPSVSDPVGLEADPVPQVPFQPGIAEEQALVDSLKGQTIQDVKFEQGDNKVRLTLTLATTDWPAVLEWERGGKLAFVMKNRRYVLQKKWS